MICTILNQISGSVRLGPAASRPAHLWSRGRPPAPDDTVILCAQPGRHRARSRELGDRHDRSPALHCPHGDGQTATPTAVDLDMGGHSQPAGQRWPSLLHALESHSRRGGRGSTPSLISAARPSRPPSWDTLGWRLGGTCDPSPIAGDATGAGSRSSALPSIGIVAAFAVRAGSACGGGGASGSNGSLHISMRRRAYAECTATSSNASSFTPAPATSGSSCAT